MGILNSKQSQALLQARNIREDLYSRVEASRSKYEKIFENISSEKKRKILSSSGTQLANMMDQFEVSSVQIVLCFIERTIQVAIPNNYIIDEMFEQALTEAQACDSVRKNNSQKKSWKHGLSRSECFAPFFGVPCSIKQTVKLKGRQSYGGFVSKINPIPTEETAYMELIRGMGLIPFVRSNVPQACKSVETNNNMFGYCKNIRNQERSCGGSSGGEGGLVGSLCSPIGIGSDIGGSLRIPAEFNGLFTLKPALRNDRNANAYYGKFAGGSPIKGQPGPLTHSVQDLITYSDWMFSQQSYQSIDPRKIDPHLCLRNLQHRLFQEKPKMKIGILPRLDTLQCSKSHQNSLKTVKLALQRLGHQTIEILLPEFEHFYFFMIKLFVSQKNIEVLDQIRQHEPFIKEYNLLHLMSKIPWIIKRVIIFLIKKKQPRLASILSLTKPLSCKDVIESMYQIKQVKAKRVHTTFIDNKIDALIMPGFAVPSPRLGSMSGLQYCLAFHTGWNVLEYPAGNLPVKLVEEGETEYSDKYNDTYTKNMQRQVKGSEGMPVGVQVIALPKKEQNVLYVMQELQKQIKFNQKYGLKIDSEKVRRHSQQTAISLSQQVQSSSDSNDSQITT